MAESKSGHGSASGGSGWRGAVVTVSFPAEQGTWTVQVVAVLALTVNLG